MAGKAMECFFEWLTAHPGELTVAQVHVGYAIAFHINPRSGAAWPSLDTLEEETGMSRPTVWRALDALEKAGILVRRRRKGTSTMYIWTLARETHGTQEDLKRCFTREPGSDVNQVHHREEVGSPVKRTRFTSETRTRKEQEKNKTPLKAPQGASAADATQDTLIPADVFDTEASSNEPTGPSKPTTAAKTKWPDRYSDCPEFLEWYHVYPLKKDPKRAYKAWQNALKDGATREELLAAIGPYREECERLGRPFKYPATWLNAGSWEDEPTTGPAPGQSLQRSPGLGDVWDTLAAFAAGDADQPTHSPHMRLIEGGFHDQPDGRSETPRWPMCGP